MRGKAVDRHSQPPPSFNTAHPEAPENAPLLWHSPARPETGPRHDWDTLQTLIPYIWATKLRVVFALSCLIAAKAPTSRCRSSSNTSSTHSLTKREAFIVVPAALLLAYGVLRFSTSLFSRTARIRLCPGHPAGGAAHLAAGVPPSARTLAALSLERQTGGLTRDIRRGTARSAR